MGKFVFAGDYVRIHIDGLPESFAWASGLNAEVLRVQPSGLVEIRLFNSGAETVFELPEACCEKVQLASFEVTVSRLGGVSGILAQDKSQAMDIADRITTADEVRWSEDWPATDAILEEENE